MIASVIALSGVQVPQVGGDTLSVLFSVLLCLILWIGYGTVFEASPWQATLGKRLMRLRVYDSQAGRLVLIHAAGRNLLKDGPFHSVRAHPGRPSPVTDLAGRSPGGAAPQSCVSGDSRPRHAYLGGCFRKKSPSSTLPKRRA